MIRFAYLIGLVGALALAGQAFEPPAYAQDARYEDHEEFRPVQWRMFKRGRLRTGWTPLLGPQTDNLLWSIPSVPLQSSPVIGRDGTIYVGSDNGFFNAFNPDGTLKWSYDTGSRIEGPPAIVRDGPIYFPSANDQFALDLDGTFRWRFRGRDGYGLGSAPAVGRDGTIYLTSHLNVLYAIASDGSQQWKYEPGGFVSDVPSSPAVGPDGTIYYGDGNNEVIALNPDGTLTWSYPDGSYHSALSIGGDGTIYIGDGRGYLHALSADGSLSWSRRVDGTNVRAAPSVGRGRRLYAGGFNGFYALAPL